MVRFGLIAFAAVVLLAGITAPLYRNEGLRARLAAESLEAGDWLTPRLYGEPHLTKPPGMGVMISICSLPFGTVTPISARLPSVVAGAALMAMVGVVFAQRFDREAGLAAAALVPCSVFWLDRVPSAEIDLVQTAWVTGSLLCLLHAVESNKPYIYWLAALACVGGGLFTKWTGPAFFYLTAVVWLRYRHRLHLLASLPHLLAATLLGLVFGLWLWNAHQLAGGELFATLEREAMMRLSPTRHPRPYPWSELLTFPLSFFLGCAPAALLLILAFWYGKRGVSTPRFGEQIFPSHQTTHLDERQAALVSLAWAWLLTSLVFWTVVPGHRPRHILPAQPAVAILCAAAWVAWRDGYWNTNRNTEREVSPCNQHRSTARCGLIVVLFGWLAIKLAFVSVMSNRPDITATAQRLRNLVPTDEVLGLVELKDEGLLFAYGRAAQRGERVYSLMPEATPTRGEVIARLSDSQGDGLKLVRTGGAR